MNGQAILPISSYPPADALTKILLATHGPCATPCYRHHDSKLPDIDLAYAVMAAQAHLVEIVHTLKQVVNVKG